MGTVFLQINCEDNQESFYDTPLIGLWEEAVNTWNWDDPEYDNHCEGPHDIFEARWQFNENGRYYLDFGLTIYTGWVGGYSIGEYELNEDSILIVNSMYDENLGYASMSPRDTFKVQITDTTFISSYSFANSSCKRYWVRFK